MIEKLKQNNKIIINSDIDGVISGLLLTNFCNCEVVGFSNSADRVWLDTSKCNSIYDGVYIDMYVPNKSTITIDQHIVAINNEHLEKIKINNNKINPNIYNPRFLSPTNSYIKKYPFGTCHFIISMLCKNGINLSSICLNNSSDELMFIDYLLRADDAMNTSISRYKINAQEWWNWLLEYSNKSETIKSLTSYLYSIDIEHATKIKTKITERLINQFKCERPDGGFIQIMNENGRLKQNLIDYILFISDLSNLKCFDLNISFKEFRGVHIRTKLSKDQQDELMNHNSVNGEKVFSYAFVRSIDKAENFSYTVMVNQ
ncbi:MAG: hypothetical protein WBJ36_02000 [Tenuifilum sp.]|uniref:hypothetical protein n=1 Tax=Tenuifilum sp. TaxID=2760880 RepID=UPI001B6D365F|nr:hypothetical protein [Bacteroidales bacterium]HOK61287.1 hypothetical protein [Tenuifilum sp.]MBP9029969.1 hypothetical protein [Bacteroidales bacterium]HOK85801.1 hypothetical protein [Tenuifilum sp.]HON70862.1 hypothetical protein [Tenuifilum sp.]